MLTSPDNWQAAQAGELEYHQRDGWRASPLFMEDSAALFAMMGLGRDAFDVVIDVGAGSRLRTAWFNAHIIAIEPLVGEYRRLSWCDLYDRAVVWPVPAEKYIDELHGRGDLVISINVLDHCQDFFAAVANIARYAKPGGLIVLSYDIEGGPDPMHPLELDEAISEAAFTAARLTVVRKDFLPAYRTGRALTYWLKP